MRRFPAIIIALFLFLTLAGFATVGAPALPVNADFECGQRYQLRIDIQDLAGEPLALPGAFVTVWNDPQDGLGSRVYVDNGANDDSVVVGRILEASACSTDDGTEYVIELSYLGGACTPETDVQATTLYSAPDPNEASVIFAVHDCEGPTATPTKTPVPPTQTPVVVVATPTPIPPTVTPVPVFFACVGGSVVNLAAGQQCPPPPTAIPTIAAAPALTGSGVMIVPPATGDGGLR